MAGLANATEGDPDGNPDIMMLYGPNANLHNEQRRRSNQPTNFYSSAAEGSGTVLGQDVDDVIAMQWHEEDVDESVELAQRAAGAGLLPLEPPSATVSPVSSPQQSSSKKKSSKKKARAPTHHDLLCTERAHGRWLPRLE